MKIQSFFKDVLKTTKTSQRRKDSIKNAPSSLDGNDPIYQCAKFLHPGKMKVKVVGIRNSSLTSKTFTFSSTNGHFPLFKPGQFMTLEFVIGQSLMTRTYSISSAPYETRGDNPIVEITVKRIDNGLTSKILYDETKIGDEFTAEIGLGQFYYDPIRDSKELMLLAGGGGITPFAALLKEIYAKRLNVKATLLYGSNNEEDIVLKNEIEKLECDNIKIVHVISNPSSDYKGEVGYLDANLIKKYQHGDMTYFICGPKKMYDFLRNELSKLSIPSRRIRYEGAGQPDDISKIEGYPLSSLGKVYSIKVRRGIKEDIILANYNESLAVALERAGIKIHIGCRGGECGFCRIKVEKGTYFVSPYTDYRRETDKDFGYVHSCSTYPTSDMTIIINIDC